MYGTTPSGERLLLYIYGRSCHEVSVDIKESQIVEGLQNYITEQHIQYNRTRMKYSLSLYLSPFWVSFLHVQHLHVSSTSEAK